MAALTTQEQIDIGHICQVLAANELKGGKRHGASLDKRLPNLLNMTTDTLEDLLAIDPTSADLVPIGNYLVSISKGYPRAINYQRSGGSVASTVSITTATPLDWKVSATATAIAPLATGESTVTFDGTLGFPDLRGFNMDFFRGGQPQYTTNPGDGTTYYYWNKVSGVFIIYGAAQLNEQMRISPI